ncbi:MAG: outer membrane protein assembly factor BamA [Proteobacteria bacterium]|nr:outer membrane protein assembly factor BamA [Pseudomonadota bacterium]MBW3617480.1 outer membrane protein assembly factor BamA [Pseudomonadota bacterium]
MVKSRACAAALITTGFLLGSTALTPAAFAQGPVPGVAPGQPVEGAPSLSDPVPSPETPNNASAAQSAAAPETSPTRDRQIPPLNLPDAAPATGAQPAETPAAPAPAAPAAVVGQTGPVIGRIIVRGNERIEAGTVLSYLTLQPGQRATPERLDLALDALNRTGLFADLALEIEGSDLIVRVVENPIINQVVFEGNSALTEEKLRDEVQVRPRGIFTRSRVQQDVQRIVELYRSSGRIGAVVTPKVVQLPQKRVDLIFEINEGPKTGVARINFLGNREFSDRDLRGVVATSESRFYRFFSSTDTYDPDRLEYDREQLRKHYTNRGFYDFRVVSSTAELTPDQRDFRITFTVDEGRRYRFGDLKVETQLQRLNAEVLERLVPIKEGDEYKSDQLEQAVDALTFAAGAAGFANVEVRPRETPNRETGVVDVTFQVREGPRVYVERIDVVGNTATLDPVIRRELRLVEGDAFNRVLLDRSRNDVRRLGFFKDVTVEELPGSAPDRTVLQVGVQEQPTGSLSFGAAFSSAESFSLDVGVTQSNFRGRGQDVRFRASAGQFRQILDISFTEPRFLGRDLSGGFDLFAQREDYTDFNSFATSSAGGSLRLGFPTSQNSFLFTRYVLRQNEVTIPGGFCGENDLIGLCAQQGSSLTSAVGYTYRLDTRNQPRRPTRGYNVLVRQDFAGLGGDVRYIRSEAEGDIHYGIRPNWVFSGQLSGGYIKGLAEDSVRYQDRFFKGGNSFRGFDTLGIGPRDVSRDSPLGGNAYVIGSLELRFPTPLPEQYGIGTAVFVEAGTLGLLDDRDKLVVNDQGQLIESPFIQDDLALRASAGLSIFWDSPLGPIRFDLSQPLAREPYDKVKTFRFSTATQF